MKTKKLKAFLITTLLSFSLLAGCSGPKTVVAVTDNTLYQSDASNTTPCYLNNVTMNVDNDILESDTLKGSVDIYTLELYDDGVFLLLCNMYQHSLDKMDATNARDCLLDYFEDTAISLNLDKIEGKYIMAQDISPFTGKETDFYKIIFSGAKIEVEDISLEGQAALVAYDDICVAAIIGTANGTLSSSTITNMMKSVAVIESEDFSTGSGSKPSYKLPDKLLLGNGSQDAEDDYDSKETENNLENDESPDDEDLDDDDFEANDKPSRSGSHSAGAAASSDILATSITMNGITISYPTSYDDLVDSGFIPGEEADYMVPGNGIEVIMFALEGGAEFNVFFRNTTESELPISQCALYGLDIDTYYFSESDRIVIGDSIVMNETTKDELLSMATIEPYFEYEADDYYSVVYENPEDDSFSNEYGFLDHVLTDFTMYFPYD